LTGEWEGGGGYVAESSDYKKAWASINRAILSAVSPHPQIMALYGWFHKILLIFRPLPVLWIDPNSDFLFDADPDADLDPIFHHDADPDQDPSFKKMAQTLEKVLKK
jgi:hypothetical protein